MQASGCVGSNREQRDEGFSTLHCLFFLKLYLCHNSMHSDMVLLCSAENADILHFSALQHTAHHTKLEVICVLQCGKHRSPHIAGTSSQGSFTLCIDLRFSSADLCKSEQTIITICCVHITTLVSCKMHRAPALWCEQLFSLYPFQDLRLTSAEKGRSPVHGVREP